MANLPQRVLEVAVEKNDRTHLMHEPAGLPALDDTTSAAHQKRLALGQAPQHRRLVPAKAVLPILGKDVTDAFATRPLHKTVGINEAAPEERTEVTGQGRLARSEKPDKEDVVATLVDHIPLSLPIHISCSNALITRERF